MAARAQRETPRQGWLEAATRITGQLLRSARARDNLRLILNHVDAHNAAELVRVALQTDPEVPMAVLGAAPRAANALIEASRELAAQVAAKPRALVREAGRTLWEQVAVERAGEAVGVWLSVVASAELTTERTEDTEEEEEGTAESAEGAEGGAFLRGLCAATEQQLGKTPLELLAPALLRGLAAVATAAERALDEEGADAAALRDLARGADQILQRCPNLRRLLEEDR